MSRLARFFWITLASVLALDMATKWLVEARFELGELLTVFPGVYLRYVRNPGAAFSLFATWPAWARRPLFLGVTTLAFWVVRHYFKALPKSDWLSAFALGLVSGGALGNLVDRVRYGEVVDFVEIGKQGVYTWPIFNVADSAVCVGVFLILWRSYRPHPEAAQPLDAPGKTRQS